MDFVVKWLAGATIALTAGALPGLAAADDAADMMKSRLGTTNADPVIVEAFTRAAKPVTPEMRAKAIECWNNNSCDTGTGGKIKVAYADGFGENVWRRVTAMEFIEQALTYPEIGHINAGLFRSRRHFQSDRGHSGLHLEGRRRDRRLC